MKKKIFILPILIISAFVLSGCQKNSEESQAATASGQSSQLGPTPTSANEDRSVKGVYLNYDKLDLAVGKSTTLKAIFDPDNAINQSVTWESSNTSVATVENGLVTAVAVGETDVKVTSAEGGFTATCHVTTYIKTESDTYVPDTSDTSIYFITNDTLSNGTYDATADEYTFSISGSSYKQIYVNAPDKTIVIELNGVTLENGRNSPIYVMDSGDIEISAKKSTTNSIKDTRPLFTEEESDQGKGAIYVANGDLKLKGTGTLNITSTYYNAIHCKDDVKVQKQTLNISAPNHGIRGNDSVTIVSGTINITCGGDGIHTENSDISSKGNQKGNVTINGGTLTINSWSDAIQAAYNTIIEQEDAATPISITAKTNKYSSYQGDTVETSASVLYLKMDSSTYSRGSYTYAAQINGNWYKANYKGTQESGGGGPGGPGGRPGGSSTSYIYELERPNGASSFTLYRFQGSNVTSFSTESYNAKSDGKAFNDAYDMVTVSVSGSKINFGSWSNYSSGNSNSADISAKGIKAENEIYIKAGTINIQSYDDAIHANNDGSLENGETPLGNIHISGGTLVLNASDDGVHADGNLNITGGNTRVESAYEGLEANVINVSGGDTYVYATDDGMNATKGNSNPAINVSGGSLDINVPTNGDTDGIDSNGTFTVTGGVVMVKGPGSASSSGSPAAAVDTDGAVTLKGGTLAIFGGCERTPTSSVTKTLCSSKTVSAGSHTISFSGGTVYTTELKNNTNGCVVYSDLGTATLN